MYIEHILKNTSPENRNVLENFLNNSKSNVECLFIPHYDISFLQQLDGNIESFQKHVAFSKFLDCELREKYQFIDMHDVINISEEESGLLFQRVRGKVKIIIYNSKNAFSNDVFKFCGWLRMYTWRNSDRNKME